MGMNAAGLCVGTTNLRTKDVRIGVTYLSLIHRALRCDALDEAVRCIQGAQRAAAHSYYLVHPEDGARWLECTAFECEVNIVESAPEGHCNHCWVPRFRAREGEVHHPSSRTRQARMETILQAQKGKLEESGAKALLSDTQDGKWAICRDDVDGVSTNAAVLMWPSQRRMLACQGLPSRGIWSEFRL
jgi:isopenicillin-N N-acyltransferase-like protein